MTCPSYPLQWYEWLSGFQILPSLLEVDIIFDGSDPIRHDETLIFAGEIHIFAAGPGRKKSRNGVRVAHFTGHQGGGDGDLEGEFSHEWQ